MERLTEAQAPQQADLPMSSEPEPSVSPQDRERLLHEAYCADRAKLLSGSYRRDDANNPEIYVTAITLILSEFPRATVEFATDPRTGIQSTEQFRAFPPNSGEVKAFCEEDIKRAHRMAQPVSTFRKREYSPPPSFPGARANLHVLAEAPQYGAVKAFVDSGECDSRDFEFTDRGVKVALSVFQNLAGGRLNTGGRTRHIAPTDAELRAMYGKREAEA